MSKKLLLTLSDKAVIADGVGSVDASEMVVGCEKSGREVRSLIRFSLPGQLSLYHIDDALLVFDLQAVANVGEKPIFVGLHRILGQWSSKTACWKNQPQYDPSPIALLKIPPGDRLSRVRVALTRLARKWATGFRCNFGLALILAKPLEDGEMICFTTARCRIGESLPYLELTLFRDEKSFDSRQGSYDSSNDPGYGLQEDSDLVEDLDARFERRVAMSRRRRHKHMHPYSDTRRD